MKASRVVSILLVIALIASNIGAATAVELTFSTSKTEYFFGEVLALTGMTDPRKVVTLQLFNPIGDLLAIDQFEADASGNFQRNFLTFPAEASQRYTQGEYTVKAIVEGATAEKKIILRQVGPPLSPQAPTGVRVTVQSIPERYILVNRYGQLTYRVEVFRLEPKISVAVESAPNVFDEANKVTSKLSRLIEFTDSNNDNDYQKGVDADIRRVDSSELTWTNQLVNQSFTRWQYTAVLRGVKDNLNVNLNVTVVGGEGNATVTLRIAGHSFGNPSNKLALMWEGKAGKELDIGPAEFGINIRSGTSFTSPFQRLDANANIDGASIAVRSRIVEETEDLHEGDTQKIIYTTLPAFGTAATQRSIIGARIGVPVPEFPPFGIIFAFAILVSAVVVMRRRGSPIFAQMPK
ncbi:MAG: hypothetical protein FJ358_07555 [Thaumarchaeota archaeon]|nr:hypothetical protein [Nitrososphaerota archaeon]